MPMVASTIVIKYLNLNIVHMFDLKRMVSQTCLVRPYYNCYVCTYQLITSTMSRSCLILSCHIVKPHQLKGNFVKLRFQVGPLAGS